MKSIFPQTAGSTSSASGSLSSRRHLRISATLAALVLIMTPHSTGAFPVVLKTHLVALGGGRSIPGDCQAFINEYNLRFMDVAVGTRISPRCAVVGRFTLGERLMSYYSYEPFFLATSIGVSAILCSSLRARPHGLVLVGSLRGSNGWGVVWPHVKFLEAAVGAGMTFWGLNPEFELGWRREFKPIYGYPYPERWHDSFVLVGRVGLGGWYELLLGEP